MKRLLVLLLTTLGLAGTVVAAEVSVAVAANFTVPMREIATAFEEDTGHKALLAFGSTGKFYAQIRNGAPFDILLAADDKTPKRLEDEGHGVAGTRFTYAIGKLVLWSRDAAVVDSEGAVLKTGNFERIAVADPKLAPYGAAAIQTLTRLGLLDRLSPRFVQGENIAQTYQFVATGNAQLGFVALSQVFAGGKLTQGSGWVVPDDMHETIRQDAVVLTRARDNPAAQALLDYLRGERARGIIRSFGYQI
ncbi:MAG: molybdate ABC transporter substrate-binding protein [Burkholderiaceae bacterium]